MRRGKNYFKNIICILLALGIIVPSVQAANFQGENTQTMGWVTLPLRQQQLRNESDDEKISFVLVMDESASMTESDAKKYYRDAVEMFVNLLPTENTKVGVVAFGRQNSSSAFAFKALKPTMSKHPNFIRKVCELTPLSEAEGKKSIINKVSTDIVWTGKQTLIDSGLLAGLDLLSQNNVGNGKGCVILLTDGEYKAFKETGRNDDYELRRATEFANNHEWQIHCIEMDYANSSGKQKESNEYLKKITNNCSGETYPIANEGDIINGYLDIIRNYFDTSEEITIHTDENGYASMEIEVPPLVSESDIVIRNDNGVEGVQLQKKNGTGDHESTIATFGDFDDDGKDEDSYNKDSFLIDEGISICSIKMYVPEAGTWNLSVRSSPDTEIKVFNVFFYDLKIESEFIPDDITELNPLKKDDDLTAIVRIKYADQNVKEKSLGDTTVKVEFVNLDTEDTVCQSLQWNDENSCFESPIDIADLGRAGRIQAKAIVTYDGESTAEGEPFIFYTKNEPVRRVGDGSIKSELRKGRDSKNIPIKDYFINPDNDNLNFKVDCGDVKVDLTNDNTAMIIHAGDETGEYSGILKVWDEDMTEDGAIEIPIELTIKGWTGINFCMLVVLLIIVLLVFLLVVIMLKKAKFGGKWCYEAELCMSKGEDSCRPSIKFSRKNLRSKKLNLCDFIDIDGLKRQGIDISEMAVDALKNIKIKPSSKSFGGKWINKNEDKKSVQMKYGYQEEICDEHILSMEDTMKITVENGDGNHNPLDISIRVEVDT